MKHRTHDNLAEQNRRRSRDANVTQIGEDPAPHPTEALKQALAVLKRTPGSEKAVAKIKAELAKRGEAVDARDQSTSGPPQQPQFNSGNETYICTLPAGHYEVQGNGDDALVVLNRVTDDGNREFAVALLSGPEYSAKEDQAGTHIFARDPDQPAREPLSTVDLGYGYRTHSQAIAEMNMKNGKRYGQPVVDAVHTPRPLTTIGDYAKATAGLGQINRANQRFWKR